MRRAQLARDRFWRIVCRDPFDERRKECAAVQAVRQVWSGRPYDRM